MPHLTRTPLGADITSISKAGTTDRLHPEAPVCQFLDPSLQPISYRLERSTLGLIIRLSSTVADASMEPPESIAFSDDTFQCHASDLMDLIKHIERYREDLLRRIDSGTSVALLSPQTDPPVIRVTKRTERSGYFNLGELWRWRFMKRADSIPFKKHQSYGVKWLHCRTAAILADDMGLGKTLQAVAALEEMKRCGKVDNALVLCPKSLIGVWEAEIRLWAPALCTVALYSSVDPKDWNLIKAQCHVAITNYEAIRGDRLDCGSFDLVIFDEVHKLKNPNSLNYSAAYQLNPRFSWGLSGTPLENHAGDLTAILHLLDRKRVSLSDRSLSPSSLRKFAEGYILRRPRGVISDELPDVVERTEMIPLSVEQRRAYDAVRARSGSIKTVGSWITSFNRLRSICDYDPATRTSSKVDRTVAITEAIRELNEKVVVFSWRLEPLRLVRRRVSNLFGTSSVAMITGQTDSATRSSIVRTFQTSSEPFVLLCSIRATAEGLTLHAASHVVFLNEWWNPAVNSQARDRVNRIGQERTVYVYRLRSQGTVESKIDDILISKSKMFQEIVARLADSERVSSEPVPLDMLTIVQ